MTYIQNNRDDNEPEIVTLWRAVGCVCIQMDKDKGFDWIICHRGINYIVEIKNPAYKWTLRPAEKKRMAEIEQAGGKYWIIQTVEEAQGMIGM